MSAPEPVQDPQAFTLAVLMHHAGKLLDDQLRVAFSKLDLPPAQGQVLHLLGIEEGVTQGALATMMRVAPPTVSGILQRMETSGLIERRTDPSDLRLTRVCLTRPGRRKAKAARVAVGAVEEVLIDGLTRGQLRSAHRLLRRLRDNLGGTPPHDDPSVTEILP